MNQLSIFTAPNLPPNSAVFSPCQKYRYLLWRLFAPDWESNFVMFVGLNPSTATETINDPTVRRCIGFAKQWGFSALCMMNAFGYRARFPKDMLSVADPIGADNDRYLLDYGHKAKLIVAAWGNHGLHLERHKQIKAMLPNLHCLKVTGAGMPAHPLYLPKDLEPFPF